MAAASWIFGLFFLVFAVFVGLDRFTGEEYLQNDIKLIKQTPGIEERLEQFKDAIGNDMPGYKNHIYRVLTYTMHFLQNEKQAQTYYPLIEAALVFHDIGLWTDHELAYLEPSTALARKQLPGATQEELELVHNMIYWHHKVTPFVGPHEALVNAVRKADWVDAHLGFITKGLPTRHIANVMNELPNAGFHKALVDLLLTTHGNNILKSISEFSSIFKF